MFGQRAKKQAAEDAAVAGPVGIALAVGEAPGGHVEGRVVCGEEAVAAREGNGIAEDRATDGICCGGLV